MESDLPQAHHTRKKFRPNKTLLIVIIVIIILLAGGYIYYSRKLAARNSHIPTHRRKVDLSVLKQTPAPLTNQQKQQLADGTSTTTKQKIFYVTGGNFYFTPNKITVNQGDNVKILFNDVSGFHDFVIDDLRVRTPMVRPGQFVVASFTGDKKGAYEFYSSLPGQREQGMKGTLIVQ